MRPSENLKSGTRYRSRAGKDGLNGTLENFITVSLLLSVPLHKRQQNLKKKNLKHFNLILFNIITTVSILKGHF